MKIDDAVKILYDKGIKVTSYKKIDNGYFFIAQTKSNTLQCSFFIVTNEGLIESGTDYYINNQGVETTKL